VGIQPQGAILGLGTEKYLDMSIAFQNTQIEMLTQGVSKCQEAIDPKVVTRVNLYDVRWPRRLFRLLVFLLVSFGSSKE
jgi:hypothetical protein